MWAQVCGAHLGQVGAGGLRGVPKPAVAWGGAVALLKQPPWSSEALVGFTTNNLGCVPDAQGNTACVGSPRRLTHPHVFGVVGQGLQAFDDGVPVFLPLPFAEHNLQEVPRPADEGHVEQLPFRQDFGTLKGGGAAGASWPRSPHGQHPAGSPQDWLSLGDPDTKHDATGMGRAPERGCHYMRIHGQIWPMLVGGHVGRRGA